MSRHLANTFAAALFSSAIISSADEPAKAPAVSLLRQIDQGFVQVFEKVAPSVVVIEAVKRDDDVDAGDIQRFDMFFRDRESGEGDKDGGKEKFKPPREKIRSEGSGFVIRSDGYILTNVHVVADSDKLEVRLKDGRRFQAKIVGSDDGTDIAVIKIEAKDLIVAEFGDSDALKIGQLVCAIGVPFNQDYSFTCGWVSGKGRTNLLGQLSKAILYEDYIQTDALINPGNSGGPLFDVDGRIVGMNTLINGVGRGLAFAIPSAMLADVSKQLIADGKVRRARIGVRVRTLAENPALREHFQGIDSGVFVDTIEADGPALKSDLRAIDVITHVDGVTIAVAKEFQKEIAKKKIGQVVQLTIWRAGRTLKIPVTTGEVGAAYARVSTTREARPPVPTADTLGLKLKDAEGARAVVAEVAPDGPAARSGLRVDDVITDVESKPVASPRAVFDAIAAGTGKSGKKGILMNVERAGKRTFVVLEPAG